jgi:hypothetical protein
MLMMVALMASSWKGAQNKGGENVGWQLQH